MHWDTFEWYKLNNFFFQPLKQRNAVSLQNIILRERTISLAKQNDGEDQREYEPIRRNCVHVTQSIAKI